MNRRLTLTREYRGFDADTQFDRIATYGSWHPASAKLETVDSARRIEVTAEELAQFFAA